MDELEESDFDEDQEIAEQSEADKEQDNVLAQAREDIDMYQNSLSVLEAIS
ncbi:TPA: hypothetical protein OZU68_005074, partial [Escherichia coli]|nr:hypothetical protein [Escherichia coli]